MPNHTITTVMKSPGLTKSQYSPLIVILKFAYEIFDDEFMIPDVESMQIELMINSL